MTTATRPMRGPLQDCGPIARWALTVGTDLGSTDAPDLPLDAWRAELAMLTGEGLSPFLVKSLPDTVSSSDIGEVLRGAAFRATAGTMRAVQTARTVLGDLEAQGVPFTVIKGPAVRPWHRHPHQRCFSDIDIVVEPGMFWEALSIAGRSGFEQPAWPGFAWKGFALEVMEGVNLHAATGGNLDVHHHLSPWVFSLDLPAVLIRKSAACADKGEFRYSCASPEVSIVVAALHIINDLWKGRRGLQSWRDILILGEHLGPEEVQRAFNDCGCGWLLTLVSESLHDLVPNSAVARAERTSAIPLSMRIRLKALGWGGPSLLTTQGVSWAARLPVQRAVLFLLGSIVPSPTYVRTRDGGYLRYWARCVRQSKDALRGGDARTLDVSTAPAEGVEV